MAHLGMPDRLFANESRDPKAQIQSPILYPIPNEQHANDHVVATTNLLTEQET